MSIVKELRKDGISMHYASHGDPTDLTIAMDQGRWTTRLAQTRAAYSHHGGDCEVPRQDAGK